jgi:lia operon protein LiaG
MTMRMMKTTMACLAVVGLLVRPASAQEVQRLSGQDVAVYTLAGSVHVVRGTGADVLVRITRGGGDASQLRVETGQIDGRSTLRVVFPDDEIVYPGMGRRSSTTMSVRADGTFGNGNGRSGSRVRIRGSGDGLEAWADLVVEVPAGRTFAAYLGVGEMEATGLSGDIRLDSGSGSVTATDMSGSLDVDTGSGQVTVRRVDGNLRIDTGSGGVEVEAVVGADVQLDTGSGRVRVSGVEAQRFSVDTGSGSVSLEGISAPIVVVDTGSGAVDIELLTDVDQLDVDTGSGSVTVRAPANLGAMVEIDTGSGGIDVDFPLEVTSVRRDRVQGRLGDGQGIIRIDTGSGGIRILRAGTGQI